MKTRKLVSLCIAAALGTVLAAPVSATSSFTPDVSNFKAVFDFDTTPASYTEGHKPGTRSDTVGDSKSEKCITAEGIGLTYDLTIDAGVSAKGNALRLDVTELAPEGGSWCPVLLNVKFGPNKLVDVSGATDFIFWVDTTKYKDTNGQHIQKGINLYIQETDVAEDGSLTDKATAWKPKAGSKGGYYLMEDGAGGWKKVENSDSDFWLPVNYQGWIKLPISTFEHTDWSTDDSDGIFNCRQIQIIQLGMGNYSIQSGATLYFDEFGFTGNFAGSADTTTTKPVDTTTTTIDVTTTKPIDGNVTTVDQESDTTVDPAETTDGGPNVSTESTGLTTDATETPATPSVTAATETVEGANGPEGSRGTGFWWIWVLAAVVVIALGGVCFYFLYVRRHPGFLKKLFHKHDGEE